MNEPIEVIVYSWKKGKKFTCQNCQKGKFEALKTINECPKCGQPHTVKVKM